MNDKKLGYIILALIVITVLSLLIYSIRILAFPEETRIISFNRISNLRIDDPIKIKGNTVGRIKDIADDDYKVLVTIELIEPVNFHKGYIIYSTDKGILGDRVIIVDPGDKNGQLINKNDTLEGTFYPGISDVLGHAWKLKDLIIEFKTTAGTLLSGTEEKPSLIATFSKVISAVDTFSKKLYNAALFLNSEFAVNIDTLYSFSASANEFIQEVKEVIPEKITTVEQQLKTISNFIDKLEKIVDLLTEMVTRIENNELLHVDHLTKLLNQLKEIQNFLEELQAGTVQLKLKLKAGF